MNTCINCGSPADKQGFLVICDDCDTASKNLVKQLENGLTLGFKDENGLEWMEEYAYEQFSKDCDRW